MHRARGSGRKAKAARWPVRTSRWIRPGKGSWGKRTPTARSTAARPTAIIIAPASRAAALWQPSRAPP